jgi:mycothiol synthase
MINIRNFTPGDEQALVDLQNASSEFDRTDRGTSLGQLSEMLQAPDFDPTRNVTLAESDGQLVAFQWLDYRHCSDGHLFHTYGFVHPDWRRRGIGAQMIGRAYAEALERRKTKDQNPAFLASQAFAHEPSRLALLEHFEMKPVREFCKFSRATLDNLFAVPALEGIVIRNYRPGVDQAATLAALNEAFQDHWSNSPGSPDHWAYWTSRPERRFDLWFLAWDGDEIAGVCLCELQEAYNRQRGTRSGCVDDVAVRRPWRKRGVGAALIVAGLRAFRNAGMTAAHLYADADNLTGAARLYKRLGFVEEWRSIAYRRPI